MAAPESKSIDLQHLATILNEVESIEYAMAFGSARDGIVHAGSDLDVAVSLVDPDAENIDLLLQIVGRVNGVTEKKLRSLEQTPADLERWPLVSPKD